MWRLSGRQESASWSASIQLVWLASLLPRFPSCLHLPSVESQVGCQVHLLGSWNPNPSAQACAASLYPLSYPPGPQNIHS